MSISEAVKAEIKESTRVKFMRFRRKHREALEAWLILTPVLLYFTVFETIPTIADLFVSFTRWSGISGTPTWTGLSNYRRFFLTPLYRLILFNSLLIAIVILLVRTFLGLVIALLLNEKVRGRGLFRVLWYIPTLTAAAVTANVFVVMVNPHDGVINNCLRAIGLQPVIWTMRGNWMRFFVILFVLWRSVGTSMVLFLAALQGIDRQLYEAAMVDGASRWEEIRFITLPLLRPMTTFVLITGMVNAMQIFDAIKVMTDGAPKHMTNVLMVQIYNDAFVNFNMGMAAAASVVLAALVLVFAISQMRAIARQADVGV